VTSSHLQHQRVTLATVPQSKRNIAVRTQRAVIQNSTKHNIHIALQLQPSSTTTTTNVITSNSQHQLSIFALFVDRCLTLRKRLFNSIDSTTVEVKGAKRQQRNQAIVLSTLHQPSLLASPIAETNSISFTFKSTLLQYTLARTPSLC